MPALGPFGGWTRKTSAIALDTSLALRVVVELLDDAPTNKIG
jgi:hypothetical protein